MKRCFAEFFGTFALVFAGTGAIVIQCIRIGAEAMIGAGAVVTRDVSAHARIAPGPQR